MMDPISGRMQPAVAADAVLPVLLRQGEVVCMGHVIFGRLVSCDPEAVEQLLGYVVMESRLLSPPASNSSVLGKVEVDSWASKATFSDEAFDCFCVIPSCASLALSLLFAGEISANIAG